MMAEVVKAVMEGCEWRGGVGWGWGWGGVGWGGEFLGLGYLHASRVKEASLKSKWGIVKNVRV